MTNSFLHIFYYNKKNNKNLRKRVLPEGRCGDGLFILKSSNKTRNKQYTFKYANEDVISSVGTYFREEGKESGCSG